MDGTTVAGAVAGRSPGGRTRLAEATEPSPDGAEQSLGETAGQAGAVRPGSSGTSGGRHSDPLPGGRTAGGDGEGTGDRAVDACVSEPSCTVRISRQFTISSAVEPEALTSVIAQLGWRVYATNQAADGLSFAQDVEAYRDEYLVERSFGRLKGHPLSLSPMYVERDDHATGLVRLLSIALRVLTLVEFVVRRRLAQEGAALAGLYAGNPKRATTHPTTERLLEAFQEITLTLVVEPHQTLRHLTALSPLQLRVLALLEVTPTIYTKLSGEK